MCAWIFRSFVLALAACGSNADVHFDVTRPASQSVIARVCFPDEYENCEGSTLFEGNEDETTVRTFEIFLQAATPAVDLYFQQMGNAFCTIIGLELDVVPVTGAIRLGVDGASATFDCAGCTIKPCSFMP